MKYIINRTQVILHNIEEFPFPLKENQFDAIVSNGLFHLIHPLEPVFTEIKRILKSNGIIAFTFENTNDISESVNISQGIWERRTKSGVLTYRHSNNIISKLLVNNNFTEISQTRFLAFTNKELEKSTYFIAIVAQLQPDYSH